VAEARRKTGQQHLPHSHLHQQAAAPADAGASEAFNWDGTAGAGADAAVPAAPAAAAVTGNPFETTAASPAFQHGRPALSGAGAVPSTPQQGASGRSSGASSAVVLPPAAFTPDAVSRAVAGVRDFMATVWAPGQALQLQQQGQQGTAERGGKATQPASQASAPPVLAAPPPSSSREPSAHSAPFRTTDGRAAEPAASAAAAAAAAGPQHYQGGPGSGRSAWEVVATETAAATAAAAVPSSAAGGTARRGERHLDGGAGAVPDSRSLAHALGGGGGGDAAGARSGGSGTRPRPDPLAAVLSMLSEEERHMWADIQEDAAGAV